MHSHDIVIVGGGLVGSATAYFLLAADPGALRVAVLEPDPSYANAPSARATGGIRQQFSTPENIQIGLFGAAFVKDIDRYLSIDGEPTGVPFTEQGYLTTATRESLSVMVENQTVQRALGADIVLRTQAQTQRDFPWLDCGEIVATCFGASGEGWTDPYALLQAFRRKAIALGAEYLQLRASGFEIDPAAPGRVSTVRVDSGARIGAGQFVIAAGAEGAAALARTVGIDPPIESRRRCTYVFDARVDLRGAPLTVLPNNIAFRPEGRYFLANAAPPAEDDPPTRSLEIDYGFFDEVIWPGLARYVPDFEAIKLVQAYACHYDVNTLDENVLLGPLPGLDNLQLAAGFSGHGMQQAPAVGRALSELLLHGEYRSLDLSGFGYQRVLTGEGRWERNCW